MTRVMTLLLIASAASAQTAAPGNDTIREDELRADLFFLASDDMRGRLTETPENTLAASFIRARFERLGLKPMGPEGSYYQPFRLMRSVLGETNTLELVIGDGPTYRAQLRREFHPTPFSPTASAEGELAFVGYGLRAPKLGHDDYRGDVRGKIVLVLEHEPGEKDADSRFDGVVASEYSRDIRKAMYAQTAGAVGVLFVSDVHNHDEEGNFEEGSRRNWPDTPSRVPRYALAVWAEAVRIPVAEVSPALLGTFFDVPFVELTRRADAPGGMEPKMFPSVRVRLTTGVERTIVSDRNVVAAIEGSDPQRKDEWVVICAHYDHDGADGARVFNGADDDGSGSVALLEIAEAYATGARQGAAPRRSVLFAAWNSEERGLLGAWAYAEAPLVPLAQTVATLNMDMIGRNEEVPVGGGRRFRGLELQTAESNRNTVHIMGYTYSGDLKRSVEEANRFTELELEMDYDNNESNLLRRSDQWPFLQKGVPSLFFHTGLHPDYHTEFDVPERIQYEKMTRIARLVHQLSWELAQADGRPQFDRPERAAAIP
ncbi:MAG TPA: M28 family peptidase [Vicinamibacteria bacterium]|nr:M28 family peptidase [Vicinamibacteria bacterium]